MIGASDWLLDPVAPVEGVDYGFRFSPADVLMALIVQAGSHEPVTLLYDAPFATGFGPMAAGVAVTYKNSKTDLRASLDWNFQKARWNDEVDLREPSVGQGYTRLSAADITKMLSGI